MANSMAFTLFLLICSFLTWTGSKANPTCDIQAIKESCYQQTRAWQSLTEETFGKCCFYLNIERCLTAKLEATCGTKKTGPWKAADYLKSFEQHCSLVNATKCEDFKDYCEAKKKMYNTVCVNKIHLSHGNFDEKMICCHNQKTEKCMQLPLNDDCGMQFYTKTKLLSKLLNGVKCDQYLDLSSCNDNLVELEKVFNQESKKTRILRSQSEDDLKFESNLEDGLKDTFIDSMIDPHFQKIQASQSAKKDERTALSSKFLLATILPTSMLILNIVIYYQCRARNRSGVEDREI